MANPGTITDSAVNTYTAPANTTLSASTTYWVVTSNSAATDGTGFNVTARGGTGTDSGTAAGWSIGNARFKSDIADTSWASTTSSRHRFAILGTSTATNNPPTVATVIPGPGGDGGHGVQLCVSGHHVQRHRRRHADLHGDEIRRRGAAHVAGVLRRHHARLLGHAGGRGRGDGLGEGDGERRQWRVGQRRIRHHGQRRGTTRALRRDGRGFHARSLVRHHNGGVSIW